MSQNEGPGGEKPEEVDTGPPQAIMMESLVMSVAHHWHLRETAARQAELIERHFRQDEMLAALRELETLVTMTKVQKRQAGAGRSASRAQAEDIVNVMKQLGDRDALPRFLIQSDDLRRVAPLLGAVSVGDERGVAARLEALEHSHRQGMEEVKRMVAAVARGAAVPTPSSTPTPVIEVTAPTSPSFAAVASGGGVGGVRGRAAQVKGQPGQDGTPSFYNRERQEGAGKGRQQLRQDRSTSASKRQRLDDDQGFEEVRRRRGGGRQQHPRPSVIKGTSDKFAELAGPVHFWVGKCRPELEENRIKEIIMSCAESCEVQDFKIESVKCLTKEPNPWSKSFKVSVPAKFEEAMMNPMMYLPTWEARPFTFWPGRGRQPPGHPGAQQQGLQVEVAAVPAGHQA